MSRWALWELVADDLDQPTLFEVLAEDLGGVAPADDIKEALGVRVLHRDADGGDGRARRSRVAQLRVGGEPRDENRVRLVLRALCWLCRDGVGLEGTRAGVT
jgi:hypothetical protein